MALGSAAFPAAASTIAAVHPLHRDLLHLDAQDLRGLGNGAG